MRISDLDPPLNFNRKRAYRPCLYLTLLHISRAFIIYCNLIYPRTNQKGYLSNLTIIKHMLLIFTFLFGSRGNLTPKSPQPFGGTSFSSPLQVPTYVADGLVYLIIKNFNVSFIVYLAPLELRRVGSVDSFSIAGAHGEAFSPCEGGLPSTSPGASFGSFSFSGMLELCDPNDVPHFTILTQQLPFPELHQVTDTSY